MTVGLGELSGVWNFRDVAEYTGIRPGRLYRSSELSALSDAGRDRFVDLAITDVADLRSHREVQRWGPGLVPEGVEIHMLPFHFQDDSDQDAPHESTFQRVMSESPGSENVVDAARRYMVEVYQEFPTLLGAHTAVRQVISLLAAGRPVLAHCFAGKDRTGFTVATVLNAVGMPRDAVLADFLRSNDAIEPLREHILESVRARSAERSEVLSFAEARLTDEVLGVREEYLDAAWRTLEDHYGSTAGFLQAAGVTETDLVNLRATLLG